ncbi:MAG: methionyl-tRNA formyltransferase [Candidatus Komeilibacteria bacterium RIFCSPLOWO2_02_FULL_48_11]|uniref:Methionyl-tRNA formyltransferase n=1 Tax=Candidatus Komeilibacteria bacterium RIFCSPLOWO2_02_FULL_48_11 TaxID=1798553 RepID=A0A1G2BVZ2_9BACT|nr:MAG: methionyl-tRNA formyltransferase [Candidatus Komeilibacteria bacterium RIFCSPLOWO2_02_FULL_48_11]
MKKNKCQAVFFGTPDFAVPSLEALSKASAKGGQAFCNIKTVVTQPDKPVGRHQSKPVPSSVKQACQRLKLPVLEGLDSLKDVEADLGIVVAYGEILPKWLLDHFPLGIVNVHPSLLPKYRGPSPIQAAILNQDKETGVTLIKLDDKIDHGLIVAQENHPLTPSWVQEGGRFSGHTFLSLTPPPLPRRGLGGGPSAGQLHDHLSQIGADMLIKYLPDYIAGKIKLKPQDDSKASYTKKLTKQDGKIDWKKSPQEIEAHVRAMNPWPGAWTMWRGKRLIIWKASLNRHPERSEAESRDLIVYPRDFGQRLTSLWLASTPACPEYARGGRNDVLNFEEVQLEGKKKMPFAEFAKGHPEFLNTTFFF